MLPRLIHLAPFWLAETATSQKVNFITLDLMAQNDLMIQKRPYDPKMTLFGLEARNVFREMLLWANRANGAIQIVTAKISPFSQHYRSTLEVKLNLVFTIT